MPAQVSQALRSLPNIIKSSVATVFNTVTPALLNQFVQANTTITAPENPPKATENLPKDTNPTPSPETPVETAPAPTPSNDTPATQTEPAPELSTLSEEAQTSNKSSDEPLATNN